MTGPGQEELEVGDEYALSSTSDRTCFLLRNKADGMLARLLDDDAARFRQDYADLKANFPEWKADQLLAQLWDQGGYGWLAQEEQ